MRMRSTGLGKTELVGKIIGIKKVGDYLAMDVQVVEPTNWRVRAALSMGDLFAIIGQILKPSNLAYIIVGLFKDKNPKSSVQL